MSKELEALRKIGSLSTQTYTENGISVTLTSQLVKDNCEYKIIEKALTPPTAEEVCKALSKIEGVVVRYETKAQAFINEHEQTLVVMMDSGILFRCDTLPPHFITVIGRFYEEKANERD